MTTQTDNGSVSVSSFGKAFKLAARVRGESGKNGAAMPGMLQRPREVVLLMQAMIEVRFSVPVGELREERRIEAEQKAREAFVLSLLRQGEISAGRAAEVLGIDRWRLADLMSKHGISPFDEAISREELEREVAGLTP